MSEETPITPQPQETNKDARLWAMLAHLTALVLGFVGPLAIWLIKKDEFPFVDDQGRESLNFQISILIYAVAAGILSFVGIGLLIGPAVAIFDLVMIIMASMQANEGKAYRYPLNLRLIK